jgi:hypothetical protein
VSMTAERGSRMTGSLNRSATMRPVELRMSHRPSERRMPSSCGTASARSASPAPIASSARSPLGAVPDRPRPAQPTSRARRRSRPSRPGAAPRPRPGPRSLRRSQPRGLVSLSYPVPTARHPDDGCPWRRAVTRIRSESKFFSCRTDAGSS